jgi:hypothetical protein
MKHKNVLLAFLVGLLLLGPIAGPTAAGAQTQEKPAVKIPEPGVPQIMTMEGRYVRAAYNNEGYVILGYQLANASVGGEWMLLEIGATLMQKVPDYKLTREAITLTTPDGTEVPLPTLEEFRAGHTQGLQNQAKVIRDSIDYFPPWVSDACKLSFYVDLDHPGKAWDFAELSPVRACMGRLYFKIPGGIQYGQHWLNVKFANSLVRVPFRILTKEEAKYLDKNYKDISKQVKEAFQPKK